MPGGDKIKTVMRKTNKILPLLGLTALLLSSCSPQGEEPASTAGEASSSLPSGDSSSAWKSSESPSSEEASYGEASRTEDTSANGSEGTSESSLDSSSQPSSDSSPSEGKPSFWKVSFEGVEDLSWPLNRYFDPFLNVEAYGEDGREVISSLTVDGHVDYGKEGTYALVYRYLDSFAERKVKITKTASDPEKGSSFSPSLPSFKKGSVHIGQKEGLPQPNFSPDYLAPHLKGKPVPTNKWWSCLVSQNRGGVSGAHSNSLYPGAYKSSFSSGGFEFTDNGKGFVEYGKAGPSGNELTASVHGNFFLDTLWKTPTLSPDYQTEVIDYSDASLKVACRNEANGDDEMVATLTQASPFAYLEIKGNELRGSFRSAGITKPYLFFDLEGNPVSLGQAHAGDSLIVCLQGSHVGYETTPWGGIGAPIYQNLYFLLVAKDGSGFAPVHRSHPDPTMADGIDLTLSGNYLALAPLGKEGSPLEEIVQEARALKPHAYSKVASLSSSYRVDHEAGEVVTSFSAQVERLQGREEPVLGLFPHQRKNSSASPSPYFHEGFRGKVSYLYSSSFETVLPFEGILPTLPLAGDLDKGKMKGMLEKLDEDNVPGKRHFDNDSNSYINKSAPYWNAKSLYPLSIGLSLAEQMGEEGLSSSFKSKLESVLSDWLSYDPNAPKKDQGLDQAGDRYFHYDSSYGALYFSDGEFNTASELSDHHFTHGYLIYAAAMLSIYDPSFLSSYRDILDFEVGDIATFEKDDPYFPYLRCFDPYMGHCWANGLGDFGDGNNEESEGEALSAWAACYLYGQVSGNLGLIDASIYGYVSELESAKTYWFDYGKEVWPKQAHDSGIGVMAIQWGGKYDYATWFGANPSFIYGIEWLPIGTYLSGYAQDEKERARLQEIYSLWEKAQSSSPLERTWRANFASVCSLFDPGKALSEFDEEAMREEDYPNEIPLSYAFATSNRSLGFRKRGLSASNPRIGFSNFQNGAYLYNPTDALIRTKIKAEGKEKEIEIAPRSYFKA